MPESTVRLITLGPTSNGHSPASDGRHFKRTWLIVVLAVAALITIAVAVHW
jgi:hypothetical protein